MKNSLHVCIMDGTDEAHMTYKQQYSLISILCTSNAVKELCDLWKTTDRNKRLAEKKNFHKRALINLFSSKRWHQLAK